MKSYYSLKKARLEQERFDKLATVSAALAILTICFLLLNQQI